MSTLRGKFFDGGSLGLVFESLPGMPEVGRRARRNYSSADFLSLMMMCHSLKNLRGHANS